LFLVTNSAIETTYNKFYIFRRRNNIHVFYRPFNNNEKEKMDKEEMIRAVRGALAAEIDAINYSYSRENFSQTNS
jgi:hypothetical protein